MQRHSHFEMMCSFSRTLRINPENQFYEFGNKKKPELKLTIEVEEKPDWVHPFFESRAFRRPAVSKYL